MTIGVPKVALLTLIAVSALSTGCIVLPVDGYGAFSRRNVKKDTGKLIEKQARSREDVLLLLGEPDYCSDDGMVFGYAWIKVYWVAGEIISGNVASGGKSFWLEIDFDAGKRVVRTELHEKGWIQ